MRLSAASPCVLAAARRAGSCLLLPLLLLTFGLPAGGGEQGLLPPDPPGEASGQPAPAGEEATAPAAPDEGIESGMVASGAAGEEALPPESPDEPPAGPPALGLADCLRLARENNELLSLVELDVESSRFGVQTARKEFGFHLIPALDATLGQSGLAGRQGSLSLTRRLVTGTSFELSARSDYDLNQFGDFYNSDVRLTLTQPLLRNFGLAANREGVVAAEQRYRYSRWDAQREGERLALDVVAAYFDMLREVRYLEAGRRAVESAEGLLGAADARLQAGRASRLDLFRAEQQLLRARSEQSAAEQRIEGLKDRMRLLLGLSWEAPLALLPGPLPAAWAPTFSSPEGAVDAALAHRLDLQQAEMMAEDAARRIGVARNRLLPGLDVNLSAARRGTAEDFRDSFSQAEEEFYVYLSTRFSTDRAAARQDLLESRLGEKRMRILAERLRREITAEVRGLWRELEVLRQNQAMQEKSLEYARAMAELGKLRFLRGLADNFDVVESEEELIRAEAMVAALQAQEAVLTVRLRMATGTLDPFSEAGEDGPPAAEQARPEGAGPAVGEGVLPGGGTSAQILVGEESPPESPPSPGDEEARPADGEGGLPADGGDSAPPPAPGGAAGEEAAQ